MRVAPGAQTASLAPGGIVACVALVEVRALAAT